MQTDFLCVVIYTEEKHRPELLNKIVDKLAVRFSLIVNWI